MTKKRGNKRWRQQRATEFNRQRTAMGYGSGWIDPMVRAAIMQRVEASGKFPKVEVREFDPPPEVLAQRNNERLELAARVEADFNGGYITPEDFEDEDSAAA